MLSTEVQQDKIQQDKIINIKKAKFTILYKFLFIKSKKKLFFSYLYIILKY